MIDVFEAYEKDVKPSMPVTVPKEDTLFDIPTEEEKAPVVPTTKPATPTGDVDKGALAAEVAKLVMAELRSVGIAPKSEEGGSEE